MSAHDAFQMIKSVHGAAELAALAIGRLDQALAHHPLRLAWAHRARLRAAIAAAALNGWKIDAEQLYGRLAGIPGSQEADFGASSRALRIAWAIATIFGDRELADDTADDRAHIRPLLSDAEVVIEALHNARDRRGSTLLAAADVAWSMRWQTDTEAGMLHAALPAYLAQVGITGSPLYGLAAFPRSGERDDRDGWSTEFLLGLARAADAERAHLGGLALSWQGWVQRVESRPRRSTSSLPALLPLVAQSPALSPALAARCLRLSVRGAALLLGELEDLGVVVEVTGRRASKLYAAADLRPDRRNRAPTAGQVSPKVAGRDIDALIAEMDAALTRVERTLGGPSVAGVTADEDCLLHGGWGEPDADEPLY